MKHILLVSLVIIIISLEKYDRLCESENSTKVSFLHLDIAILSTRENFEKRRIIRDTWMKHVSLANRLSIQHGLGYVISAHFVIGSHHCHIHPFKRVELFGCEDNELDLAAISPTDLYSLFHFTTIENDTKYKFTTRFYKGFSFEPLYDVRLKRIGILSSVLNGTQKGSVVFLNPLSKEMLYERKLSNFNTSESLFHFTDITIDLQRGVPILVILNVDIVNEELSLNQSYSSPRVLKILRSYNIINDFESERFNEDRHYFYINLQYEINDNPVNQIAWEMRVKKIGLQLFEEDRVFQDVLLVDMIDVYRNLPDKLIRYFERHIGSYPYITHFMKTDDDCFLNIFSIIHMLLRNLNQNKAWFGNFRKNWIVNHYGKWADSDYSSSVYPKFACGSGYILTRDLVKWIASNSLHLHRFQGEDVSLGIWLSSINPNLIQDTRWRCGTEAAIDLEYSFSIPNVPSTTMLQLYHQMNRLLQINS